MSELKKEYRRTAHYGWPTHHFMVHGTEATVEVAIRGGTREVGGIEVHYKQCPDYMHDREPDHEYCPMNYGRCWHDGSSLQAVERWIPLWNSCRQFGTDEGIDRMLDAIEQAYHIMFNKSAA